MRAFVVPLLAVALAPSLRADPASLELVADPAVGGPRLYRILDDENPGDLAAPGNRNGAAERGETVRLMLVLRNAGKDDLQDVSATLATDGGEAAGVSWVRPSYEYGPLRAGESAPARPEATHELRIDPGVQAPATLLLHCAIRSREGGASPRTVDIPLPLHAVPDLPVDVEAPPALAAGGKSSVRVTVRQDRAAGLAAVRVVALPDDYRLTVSPSSVQGLERSGSAELACAPRTPLTADSARLTLRVSCLSAGAVYRWLLPLVFDLPAPVATSKLEIEGLTWDQVRLERFGAPMVLDVGCPDAAFHFSLPVPARSYALRIRPRGPKSWAAPELVLFQGEARLVPDAAFDPGAGALRFGWPGKTRCAESVRVRVEEEAVWFELSPAPPDMVFVAGGPFVMGRDRTQSRNANPAHPVTLEPYYLSVFETTRAEYSAFLRSEAAKTHANCHPLEPKNKSHAPLGWGPEVLPTEDHLPAAGVDWFDAYAFAAWAGGRLPTEAEWERAAAGATPRDYPWGAEPDPDNRCVAGRLRPGPLPVDRCFPDRSPEGCYGMAGNVSEWCSDWFDPEYYAASPQSAPQGPENGKRKVVRGGSWDSYEDRVRTFARDADSPLQRSPAIGFRIARDVGR